ncbi:beta-glucosidase [Actinomadura litoris]|uniref:beta-glucosidase n=1 Tax=Actinomadura litoris TaxID=2678616 RepID=UPI001FA7B584|nr:glycoside hydrolase family 3 C-terminal domain-containing protein [Actinomadura litoris]
MWNDETELRARVAGLPLERKVEALTGIDYWRLPAVPEAGLETVVMCDGPAGVFGTTYDERDPSLLFPNPTALSATWDPELTGLAGRLMGAQARTKGAHVLLAPVLNLHRTPIGGRNFESFSEDPLLTARMAAGFVTGIQSAGVAAAVKHFVCNDSETERLRYDVRIGERLLREVYLRPFEAVVEAGAWMIMAAYNRVNGTMMTENERLLGGVLKEEWGFDGVVVSDWTATRTTEASANAGLDLIMPGPNNKWGPKLVAAVRAGDVPESLVDEKVTRLLRLAGRVGALKDGPELAPAPLPADYRERLRALAARACVLLTNDGVLPLAAPGSVALIGPNAVSLTAQGRGSSLIHPEHVVEPYDGLRRALGPGTEISLHQGCRPRRLLAALPAEECRDPETGEPGLRLDYLDSGGGLVGSENRRSARLVYAGTLTAETTAIRARGVLTPAETGTHLFSVCGVGVYTLTVGDTSETFTLKPAGDYLDTMTRPPEHRVAVELTAGVPVAIEMRHTRDELFVQLGIAAFGLGYGAPRPDEDAEIEAAVEAARRSDVAVVMVGTDDEGEAEGRDRTGLALQGRQDELVRRVAAANPRTVVVVNASGPMLLPWRDEVAAVLWSWFPGQEGGDAIADVLVGAREPAGRLPTTLPASEAGVPIFDVAPVDGVLRYDEEAVGYRAYAEDGVAFPFGHGLGYGRWEYESAAVEGDTVSVTVRNTAERDALEVVQVYAEGPRLAGFATVRAGAGERVTVEVPLDRRTFQDYDTELPGWRTRPGPHTVLVGRSSADPRLSVEYDPR